MRRWLVVALLFSSLASADIYKWTDKDGNVHFSDTPHSDAAQRVSIDPPPASPAPRPRRVYTGPSSAEQIADKMRQERLQRERQQMAQSRSSQRSAEPSFGCDRAKTSLARHERQLDRLRSRGYKQWERQQIEDWIEEDNIAIKADC